MVNEYPAYKWVRVYNTNDSSEENRFPGARFYCENLWGSCAVGLYVSNFEAKIKARN